jgi:hypothetical protein
MDPITIIVTALVAGIAAGATSVAEEAVKEAYAGLKGLILRKFGRQRAVAQAVKLVEEDPEAAGRKEFLKGELEATDAAKDTEVLAAAKELLALLQPETADSRQHASADHGSAAATGRSVAQVGDSNIALTGDIQGGVTIDQTPPKEK